MSKKNIFVFTMLHIVVWVIFIGLCIQAGIMIVHFIFSIYKPEFVSKLYENLDLKPIYDLSKSAFYAMYSFILIISILKAYLFYVVIRLISKLNLSKPFSSYNADQITTISYYTLSIGLISYIARQTSDYLSHRGFEIHALTRFWEDSQAYILMAAVLYIIATIFTRGVELQNENDLTV